MFSKHKIGIVNRCKLLFFPNCTTKLFSRGVSAIDFLAFYEVL